MHTALHKVVSAKACPQIKSGPGNVVTGKFIHESDGNLINLRIKGQKELTTVTSNHRYWSADRKEFIEAGHLQAGEQVSTLAGLKQVVSITPRTGNETVYNLEVQGEHIYLVGSLGTLVHNNYARPSDLFGRQLRSEFTGNKIKRYKKVCEKMVLIQQSLLK